MNKAQIEAYSLYYLTVNFAKLSFLIAKIHERAPAFGTDKKLSVLDFGCGPGSGLAACLYGDLNIESLYALDASDACLSFTKKLLNSINPEVGLKLCRSTDEFADKKFDLIIAANVLTELSDQERKQLTDKLISLLADKGILLLLEPAQLSTTRKLMSARAQILNSNPQLSVIFPCSIQDSCPMLPKADDWCHGILPSGFWAPSTLIRELDLLLSFNKHRLKYATFIFQRTERVNMPFSVTIKTAGKVKHAEICGENGLQNIKPSQIDDTQARRDLKASDNYRAISNSLLKM